MLRRNDYIILAIICLFLGIFIVSQFYAGKEVKRVIQPENNEVMAIEVSKLTKNNADLRREIKYLTNELDNLRNGTDSAEKIRQKYLEESGQLDLINGLRAKTGQGIVIYINGSLLTPQIVDLTNAIKNIGGEIMSINNVRIVLNSDMSKLRGQSSYEVRVLGNSTLLKSAMERKGGIVEQLDTKDIDFRIEEKSDVEIPAGEVFNIKYSKIIE